MKDGITTSVLNVLWRIFFFIIYYILLICAGVALIGAAGYITWICIQKFWVFIASAGIYGIILGGFGFFILWGVSILFAVYLIKPIFSFSRNDKPERVEVLPDEAPLLFECLENLTKEIGCKMPKHVYLTTDVNACVFYNTSFWSIFFPVRKNLEIGLGLFQATSKAEVFSILSHELGHFAQGSMKVGSTVYIVNSILHNLVFAEDFYERWIYNLSHSDNSWLCHLGKLVRCLTYSVKWLNLKMYRFVHKAYMSLSRQMEYDADNMACKVAGKEAFISSSCKIQITGGFQNAYEKFFYYLVREGKTITDYWRGYDIVKNAIGEDYLYNFDYHSELDTLLSVTRQSSRVSVDNIWDSHPTTLKRIENASLSPNHSENDARGVPSLTLIPEKIRKKIGDARLTQFIKCLNGLEPGLSPDNKEGVNEVKGGSGAVKIGGAEVITDEAFTKWVQENVGLHFIPLPLQPFLERDIIEFANPSLEDKSVENPFTETNAELLYEYETALKDWDLLNAIKDKKVDADTFTYNGIIYNRKSIPLEEHKQYLEQLHAKARDIDQSVYKFLRANSSNPNKVDYAYLYIFTAAHVLPGFSRALEYRASLVAQWNDINGDQYDFNTFLTYVNTLLKSIRGYINKEVDWPLLSTVVEPSTLSQMREFAQEGDILAYQGISKVESSFAMVENFFNAYRFMLNKGNFLIVQEAKTILSNIENPGEGYITLKDSKVKSAKSTDSNSENLKEESTKVDKKKQSKEKEIDKEIVLESES